MAPPEPRKVGTGASRREHAAYGFNGCGRCGHLPYMIRGAFERLRRGGRRTKPEPPPAAATGGGEARDYWMVTDSITTGVTGTTLPPGYFGSALVSVSLILSTTSMPSTTFPKTV